MPLLKLASPFTRYRWPDGETTMQFEILYGGTQEKLNEQVQARIAEGWETRGDVTLIRPDYSGSTIEVPQFVYYAQIVVKEN